MSTLLRSMRGYWFSQCIYAAAKLGIADLLQDGPKTISELAKATGTHEQSLYRLLRALASIGTFAEQDGKFVLTPLAEPLCSRASNSMRDTVILVGEEFTQVWSELLYSVQTGRSAFEKIYGTPFFDWLSREPAKEATFAKTMNLAHGLETQPIIAAYDFASAEIVADIGGGNGQLLAGILSHNADLKGILFDQPDVIAGAQEILRTAGVADRCKMIGGSFFESAPQGASVYMLRNIIHDWNDEQSVAILRNVRQVLPNDGRVLVLESVIPQGNEYFIGKFLDLTMLLIGGQERTESEYRHLLEAAGLRLNRVIPTTTELSILEAIAA